jgi:hypothetical protein
LTRFGDVDLDRDRDLDLELDLDLDLDRDRDFEEYLTIFCEVLDDLCFLLLLPPRCSPSRLANKFSLNVVIAEKFPCLVCFKTEVA